MGELSLDGSLQAVKGVLPMAIRAREEGFKGCILPLKNAREAAVVNGIQVFGFENIKQVVHFLDCDSGVEPVTIDTNKDLGHFRSLQLFA